MRFFPHSRFRFFSLLILVALLPVVSLLTGCSSKSSDASGHDLKMAPMSQMSAEVQKAPATVREAYQFAVANPDALQNVPCYCSCGAAGHTSNYSCYVKASAASKKAEASGEIVFDQHALGCSICVDITQDVMRMTRAGKSPKDIRTAIDATYSKYGPSNMPSAQ